MGSGLLSEIKNNPWALALVIAVHIVLIVLLSINLASDEKPPMPAAQKHKIIDAVVVDAAKYDEREKQKKLAAQKKIEDKKAAEKKRKQEIENKKKLEKQRLAEKKKQEQKLAAEKKKIAEKQKALALAKKKEADRKEKERIAKEKVEKQRLAKEQAAKEKKERELKEKQRVEAEKKRKEEEERQRRAEEKAEMEREMLEEQRREEEARVQAARAARLQTQLQQYIMQIDRAVENNWLRPATTSEEQSCEVIVTQTMSGDVIDVQLQSCSSDKAFQRSVERAVRKASPLPLPPDPELFDRKIQFTFKH
jgi:colicin import membrane protein